MNHTKLKGLLLIALMAVSGLAGCLGSEEDETTDATDAAEAMDAEDGGYTYASNVDNHRSLMKDLCDMKTAASSDGGYDFATAKDIYMNGKNAEKSDGSTAHLLVLHPLMVRTTATMHTTTHLDQSMTTSWLQWTAPAISQVFLTPFDTKESLS